LRLNRTELKYIKSEIAILLKECKEGAIKLERCIQRLWGAAGTKNLTGRAFDRVEADRLRSMVFFLYEEVQQSMDFMRNMPSSLVNVIDFVQQLPTNQINISSEPNASSTILDHGVEKAEQLEKIQKSCDEIMAQLSMLSDNIKSSPEPPTNHLPELNQHHLSQMKELEDLKTAISSLPPPPPPPPIMDWTQLKFPPLPKPPTVPQQSAMIRKEVRLSQDALLRRNNIILRGLPPSADQFNDPLLAAKSFLENCGVENYSLFQKDIISALYLNRSDGRCTIRMVFSNQWTVDQILDSAHKLKTGSELYRAVYLAKDRTNEEMRQHRELVSDLKVKRRDHPNTYWVIQNETIVNKGQYRKPK